MDLSGFSFVRNGISLYYPVTESIRSILPICSEIVVAVGKGSEGDTTREEIEAIGDRKIRIVDTIWDESQWIRGATNAIQTDIAKSHCRGDWLFYLQADEVVHERHLPAIVERCRELLPVREVEGLLFEFKHFWGDYDHFMDSHAWYRHEIRVVRNDPSIHSWHSAQSFRHFDSYEHPWQETGTRKLRVARVAAEIFHYGWVRPPRLMQRKDHALHELHVGRERARAAFAGRSQDFDYGDLSRLPVFRGTHPEVMRERIEGMDWQAELRAPASGKPKRFKHSRLRVRLLTLIENSLFGGRQVFGSRNYRVLSV